MTKSKEFDIEFEKVAIYKEIEALIKINKATIEMHNDFIHKLEQENKMLIAAKELAESRFKGQFFRGFVATK